MKGDGKRNEEPATAFGPGPRRRLNARIASVHAGGLDEKMYRYAEGYRMAALAVYEASLKNGEPPEFAVWPLAFLWRHHTELALKWLIACGKGLDGETRTFPEHHGLRKLWLEAKPYLVRISSEDAVGLPEAEASLLEIEKIDPGSMGFRYPLSRGLKGPSLPASPAEVNLERLHMSMTKLADFLDAAHMALSMAVDAASDAEALYR
jgi:hypothetical protein